MLLDDFHSDNPTDYLEGFPRHPLRDRDNQIRFPQPGRSRRQYGKQADGESDSLVVSSATAEDQKQYDYYQDGTHIITPSLSWTGKQIVP